MTLTANEFIIPDGAPAGGRQQMQSSGVGPTTVALKGTAIDASLLLLASSAVDQLPSGENTPLQVEFGAAQGGGSDPVQLSAGGDVQFNTLGTYLVVAYLSVARSGGLGTASVVHFRATVDTVQTAGTVSFELGDQDTSSPFAFSSLFTVETSPTVVRFEIARDTVGPDDGGLVAYSNSVSGWNPGNSASIRVWQMNQA